MTRLLPIQCKVYFFFYLFFSLTKEADTRCSVTGSSVEALEVLEWVFAEDYCNSPSCAVCMRNETRKTHAVVWRYVGRYTAYIMTIYYLTCFSANLRVYVYLSVCLSV